MTVRGKATFVTWFFDMQIGPNATANVTSRYFNPHNIGRPRENSSRLRVGILLLTHGVDLSEAHGQCYLTRLRLGPSRVVESAS
jgi:hypothetical protein